MRIGTPIRDKCIAVDATGNDAGFTFGKFH